MQGLDGGQHGLQQRLRRDRADGRWLGICRAAWAAVTDMDGVGGAEYRAIFRDTHVLLNDYRSSENGGDLSDAEADIGDLQTDCQNVGQ